MGLLDNITEDQMLGGLLGAGAGYGDIGYGDIGGGFGFGAGDYGDGTEDR